MAERTATKSAMTTSAIHMPRLIDITAVTAATSRIGGAAKRRQAASLPNHACRKNGSVTVKFMPHVLVNVYGALGRVTGSRGRPAAARQTDGSSSGMNCTFVTPLGSSSSSPDEELEVRGHQAEHATGDHGQEQQLTIRVTRSSGTYLRVFRTYSPARVQLTYQTRR